MRGSTASETCVEQLALALANKFYDCGSSHCPTLDEPRGIAAMHCENIVPDDTQPNSRWFQLRLDETRRMSYGLFLTVAVQALQKAGGQPLVSKEQLQFVSSGKVETGIASPGPYLEALAKLENAPYLLEIPRQITRWEYNPNTPEMVSLAQRALLDLASTCGLSEVPEAAGCIRLLEQPAESLHKLRVDFFRAYLEYHEPQHPVLLAAESMIDRVRRKNSFDAHWTGLCSPPLDYRGGQIVFVPPPKRPGKTPCDQCSAPPPVSFAAFVGHLQPTPDVCTGYWETEADAAASAVRAAAREQGAKTAQLPWAATWKPWAEYAGIFGGLIKGEWKNVAAPQLQVCSAIDGRIHQHRVISLRRLLENCRPSREVIDTLQKDVEKHLKRAACIATKRRNHEANHEANHEVNHEVNHEANPDTEDDLCKTDSKQDLESCSKAGSEQVTSGWYVGSIDQVYLTLEFNPKLPPGFNLDFDSLPSGTKSKLSPLLTPVCLLAGSDEEAQQKQREFFEDLRNQC
ncbi:hypothetical protein GNI_182670 [Gregarina niphandrodes]|uniref:Uncharacterized protein n=1 Tax=Gregarina niphandrodes TaxID=110365 RepID=A0A023AX85_GRENI|nr:hypothetical protein GNI_182670 [Gregarina niphandrodes]EZG43207.1 hypothetical protein GNI_182670 [Gregarina niphandrodes]|eukprot:XP_011133538.1 hypothetical protein GNI_182670 [Gregarina niphandrodes]